MRGGGEVPREAHKNVVEGALVRQDLRQIVTRYGDMARKNFRNCWKLLRGAAATAWLETANANAQKRRALDNQQRNLARACGRRSETIMGASIFQMKKDDGIVHSPVKAGEQKEP